MMYYEYTEEGRKEGRWKCTKRPWNETLSRMTPLYWSGDQYCVVFLPNSMYGGTGNTVILIDCFLPSFGCHCFSALQNNNNANCTALQSSMMGI